VYRRTGAVRSGDPVLVIYPERAFRYLLSNQPERFVLSVPAFIYYGRKRWLWIYDVSLFY